MSVILNKMYTECPICSKEGLHYWHHVYGKTKKMKQNSVNYNAIIYPCSECHIWGTNSIHKQKSQELNKSLKRKHRDRILEEYDMSIEKFIELFGKAEW